MNHSLATDESSRVLDLLSQVDRFRGIRGYFSEGVYWKRPTPATLIATPDAFDFGIRVCRVHSLLKRNASVLAQFCTSRATGVFCDHYVLRDRSYNERSLQRQFRQTLQRAREHFVAKRLEWDLVSTLAPEVILGARASKGEPPLLLDLPLWESLCEKMDSSRKFEAIGCFRGSSLVAINIFCCIDGCYTPIVNASDPSAMALGVSNLLIYESLRHLMQKQECQSVSLGRSGIPNRPNIGRFKRHAGLQPETVRIAVLIHPRWRWFLNTIRLSGVLRIASGRNGLGERYKDQIEGLRAACATRPELLDAP